MEGTRGNFWIKNCTFAVHIMLSIASQRNGNDDIVTKTGDTQLPGRVQPLSLKGQLELRNDPGRVLPLDQNIVTLINN